jgi:hypothetical protein
LHAVINLVLEFGYAVGLLRHSLGGDGVYHYRTKRQAEYVLSRIRKRLKNLGLELHPVKTKIVHCNQGQRARGTDNAHLESLGFFLERRAVRLLAELKERCDLS